MEIFKQEGFVVSRREDRYLVLRTPSLERVSEFLVGESLRDVSYIPEEEVLLGVREEAKVLRISPEGKMELCYESPSSIFSMRVSVRKNGHPIIQLVERSRVILTTFSEGGSLRILQELSRDASFPQRGDLVYATTGYVAAAPVSNRVVVVGRETIEVPLEYSMVKLSEDGSRFVVVSLDGRTFLVYHQGVTTHIFTRGFFSAEIRDVHLDNEFLVVGTTLGHVHLFYLNVPEKNTHSILDMIPFGSYLGGGKIWAATRRYVSTRDYLIAHPTREGEISLYDGEGQVI